MHTINLISVLSSALHRCPEAVVDAWHGAFHGSAAKLPLLGAIVFQLTGYIPSASQVWWEYDAGNC